MLFQKWCAERNNGHVVVTAARIFSDQPLDNHIVGLVVVVDVDDTCHRSLPESLLTEAE